MIELSGYSHQNDPNILSVTPFVFSGLPFEGLGASLLTFWEPILTHRGDLGTPFWHLGISLEGWLAGYLADVAGGWLAGWLADWLAGWLAG